MATSIHRPGRLLVGLLLACAAWWSDGECLGEPETTIAGRVRAVDGGTISAQPNARFTVVAVDAEGHIVARQATDDAFRLTVPSDHDYVLMMSSDDGVFGVLVWGEQERPEFAARGVPIDLGCVGLNRDTSRAFALRELDLRPPRQAARGATEPVLVTEE